MGSSTVDQVLKYTKYTKYIPSTSTGQVLIFLKKYLSTSSTFISSTSTSTSTHIIIFDGQNKRAFPKSCLLKSRWPYFMQSRFWVDKLKGLFQK